MLGVCGKGVLTALGSLLVPPALCFWCSLAVSVSQAKQKVDAYHLQLQNLLYEVMHLQKEITKCLEFK